MKTAIQKYALKSAVSKTLDKLLVKGKRSHKKQALSKDPFFSSPPVDLGRTNNKIIDEILYGKNGA